MKHLIKMVSIFDINYTEKYPQEPQSRKPGTLINKNRDLIQIFILEVKYKTIYFRIEWTDGLHVYQQMKYYYQFNH